MSIAKALVVDDNETLTENIREILSEGLSHEGIECQVAVSAGEARSRAVPDLDLALVDLHLPDATGTGLIDEIRSRAPFAQVVIITGDATVENAIRALHEGAFGYVLKPFRGTELLETARRAIERARLLKERDALLVELERSEERHRNVIESVPAFVLALDHNGRVLVWNRRLEEVTGHSRARMLGRPGGHFVGSGDVRLPGRDGRRRLVRWQQANVPVAPGEPAITLAVGVDVTEEREMQRRAVRAERLAAVGTLAAGLAHEVRNPLNSASLQLQVLERRLARGENDPESLKAVVGVVYDEIQRLNRLVNDFLAFARPLPVEFEPIRVNEVLERVLDLVRPECESAGIRLASDLDDRVELVQGNAERLRQVFLNVVRNALEAMGKGGDLVLRTRRADPQGFVRVEVRDTGPGFPENAPVFDAFYTTKEQGTGLGLAIVHSIVTEHGGTVRVETGPEGTLFELAFPESGTAPAAADE